MKPDTDPDVFMSEINQIRDELSVLDDVFSTERLTTTVLDAWPAEMYSTVKLKAIQDPDLSLEQVQRMMITIFINYSERVSVTKKNQESRKSRVESQGSGKWSGVNDINCFHHLSFLQKKR